MITIVGPTASGKTTLAAHLAASYITEGMPAEILSGDSRQVYRGMDIGTATTPSVGMALAFLFLITL